MTESRSHVETLIRRLEETEEVRGITIIEARTGLGSTKPPPGLVDPPVIVELFDHPDREEELVRLLRRLLAPRHILCVPVDLYE